MVKRPVCSCSSFDPSSSSSLTAESKPFLKGVPENISINSLYSVKLALPLRLSFVSGQRESLVNWEFSCFVSSFFYRKGNLW